jgi:hypothetical protein
VFSLRTTNIIRAVPVCSSGDALKVYFFTPDTYQKDISLHHAWRDRLSLLLSTVKLAEVGLFLYYNAVALAYVTFLTWLFFFLAGVALHFYGLLVGKWHKAGYTSVIDTIAGSLPTPSKEGGPRKVLLGVPSDPRRHLWKIIWAMGSLVCVVSVVATYIALGQVVDPRIFFMWTGLQIFWLALRSAFFHIAEDQDRLYRSSLPGKPWARVGEGEKTRVRRLMFALAKYQIYVHPRGLSNYVEDLPLLDRLHNVKAQYPLARTESLTIPITVRGVVGDTLLSSACWISGSKMSAFDFYDTCVLILHVKDHILSIPAARVLSGTRTSQTVDEEQGDQLDWPPRGSSAMSGGNIWAYWIPCDDGRWLYLKAEVMKLKGLKDAAVLTDDQVTEKLTNKELYVSLRHVDEIKEVVRNSTEACMYLSELLE